MTIFVRAMIYLYVWHDSLYAQHDSFIGVWYELFICGTWLVHMCDMTHSCAWYDDAFKCVTWLIHIRGMTHSYVCDMTRSYVRHDSFVCVTWLIHMVNMIHPYARHDSFICVWHDSFLCDTWLSCKMCANESCLYKWVMSQMSHVSTNESCRYKSHLRETWLMCGKGQLYSWCT